MNFGRSVLAVTAGMLLSLLTAVSPATATTVLYNDFTSPNWGAALAGLGITPTSVDNDADFALALNPLTVDLAIVQFDQFEHSMLLQASLASYIAGGGRVIFSSMFDAQYDAIFSVHQEGAGSVLENDPDVTGITIGSALSTGLSSPLLVMRVPELETFWRSFSILPTDLTATGLATFEDTNYAIVLGNNGRTIINGFAGSTLYADGDLTLSPADEIRLYQNEVGLLIATVPEPTTGALLGLGLLVTAALGYRRSK